MQCHLVEDCKNLFLKLFSDEIVKLETDLLLVAAGARHNVVHELAANIFKRIHISIPAIKNRRNYLCVHSNEVLRCWWS